MGRFDVYKDIQARTNGEIYLGVVGPVRTGKSTFIKRFMDLMVLPHMKDKYALARTKDELPQSASGKTIMTTEPKFIPKGDAVITLDDDVTVKVKLIDCVGYMVLGASGYKEKEQERLVKTPWFDYEIPFTKAADIGTQKVIRDHATIGLVVTTDGSIGDFAREDYIEAERQTINELKKIGKPFIVLVNSKYPAAEAAKNLVEELQNTYDVMAMAINCDKLRVEDIYTIMQRVLYEFTISEVAFYIPKWVEMLPNDHIIRADLIAHIKESMNNFLKMKDAVQGITVHDSEYIEEMKVEEIEMDSGRVRVRVSIWERFYYEMLSELVQTPIHSQNELMQLLKEMSSLRTEYEHVENAIESVRLKGYGVVHPSKEEIQLDDPMVIKQGNKYGVKIHSTAPSIHLIRANIETEIAPIVGSEAQANDLIQYIKDAKNSAEGVWGTNIFGKSIEELLTEEMQRKLITITDESQVKLQDTMQKIVNDSNGGMVCIII